MSVWETWSLLDNRPKIDTIDWRKIPYKVQVETPDPDYITERVSVMADSNQLVPTMSFGINTYIPMGPVIGPGNPHTELYFTQPIHKLTDHERDKLALQMNVSKELVPKVCEFPPVSDITLEPTWKAKMKTDKKYRQTDGTFIAKEQLGESVDDRYIREFKERQVINEAKIQEQKKQEEVAVQQFEQATKNSVFVVEELKKKSSKKNIAADINSAKIVQQLAKEALEGKIGGVRVTLTAEQEKDLAIARKAIEGDGSLSSQEKQKRIEQLVHHRTELLWENMRASTDPEVQRGIRVLQVALDRSRMRKGMPTSNELEQWGHVTMQIEDVEQVFYDLPEEKEVSFDMDLRDDDIVVPGFEDVDIKSLSVKGLVDSMKGVTGLNDTPNEQLKKDRLVAGKATVADQESTKRQFARELEASGLELPDVQDYIEKQILDANDDEKKSLDIVKGLATGPLQADFTSQEIAIVAQGMITADVAKVESVVHGLPMSDKMNAVKLGARLIEGPLNDLVDHGIRANTKRTRHDTERFSLAIEQSIKVPHAVEESLLGKRVPAKSGSVIEKKALTEDAAEGYNRLVNDISNSLNRVYEKDRASAWVMPDTSEIIIFEIASMYDERLTSKEQMLYSLERYLSIYNMKYNIPRIVLESMHNVTLDQFMKRGETDKTHDSELAKRIRVMVGKLSHILAFEYLNVDAIYRLILTTNKIGSAHVPQSLSTIALNNLSFELDRAFKEARASNEGYEYRTNKLNEYLEDLASSTSYSFATRDSFLRHIKYDVTQNELERLFEQKMLKYATSDLNINLKAENIDEPADISDIIANMHSLSPNTMAHLYYLGSNYEAAFGKGPVGSTIRLFIDELEKRKPRAAHPLVENVNVEGAVVNYFDNKKTPLAPSQSSLY